MQRFAQVARVFVVAVVLGATGSAGAQDYPSRDITFIVPFNPGGGTDPIARQFTSQLEKVLRAKINVENRPGGSGAIGISAVVRAKPDGYTIGLGINSTLAYQPLINDGLPFKSVDDYQSIVKLADLPALLSVRADAPWKTFQEFMADVKKNPGKIRASNSGAGSLPELIIEQLNKVAGVKVVSVPFSGGSGEAMVALLGGRVEANVGYGAAATGNLQAGKIRVLAVFQKGRFDAFPDAVSVNDSGYDITLQTGNYAIAPKGLPKDVLDKLVAASLQVVRSDEYLKFIKSHGFVLDPKGPDAMKAELAQYSRDFADLIKFIGQK